MLHRLEEHQEDTQDKFCLIEHIANRSVSPLYISAIPLKHLPPHEQQDKS